MIRRELRTFFTGLLAMYAYASPAAPINSQSILVSYVDVRSNVAEFSRAGTVLQNFVVPTGTGSLTNTDIEDIAMGRNGKLQIFNGRFSPFLTTLTPQSAPGAATFEHHTIAGWSHSGWTGIAIDEGRNAIYVNDMSTASPGGPAGIIQFDANTYVATRKKSGEYTGVILGRDGLLYASYPPTHPGNHMLDVIDPNSFSVLRTITLPRSHSPTGSDVTFTGYAVDAQGFIYGTEGEDFGHGISKFSPDGTRIKYLSVNISFPWLRDLALSPDGNLVTLSQDGDVVMTSTALDSYTSFRSELIHHRPVSVAWAVTTVPEPGALWLIVCGVVGTVRKRVRLPPTSVISGTSK
jgi:hypothetical protein